MKLTIDQIRSVTRGVVRVEEENGAARFYRFTDAQSNAYREIGNMDFYGKSFSSAGVRLAFVSNTERLSFSFLPYSGSSRKWLGFDLCVNSRIAAHREYNREDDPSTFRFEASLPAGEKTIELYLPFSARTDLFDVMIDDGATFLPVRRKHTMIQFGDSITHGYDSHYPSLSYANRVAYLLDADPVNKGIGGDRFFPALLDGSDVYDTPDYITVAYGTNDWSGREKERTETACREFYRKLSARYPASKIFAVTPIWRGDGDRLNTKFEAPVRVMDRLIGDCVSDLPNVTLISGESLVPHSPDFFVADCLHPNDFGFCLYAANLYEEIRKHL